MTAEIIAKALGGRKAGTAWIAPCPAHKDREPSLSIKDAEGGKLLVHCHAGCDQSQVIAELRSAQLIASHSAAMECYRRAMISEQTFEGRREELSQPNELSRTYAVLLDALNRHRGKGQQKVTVEHVHVHSGGQAIVGAVQPPGGGSHSKSEDQPHARQIAHAPQQAMWSPDTEREPVPVTRDAERTVPIARRNVAGSTEGK
jgi:hypothetical protein